MKEFYRFLPEKPEVIFPLKRVINFLPGDIVIDSPGNVFIVDESREPKFILLSALKKNVNIKGLSPGNQQRMFINITRNNYKLWKS